MNLNQLKSWANFKLRPQTLILAFQILYKKGHLWPKGFQNLSPIQTNTCRRLINQCPNVGCS